MNRTVVLLAFLLLALATIKVKAQTAAIPEARFRVLYQATNEPVKWIAVQVYCRHKLGWSERRKTGQDYVSTHSSFQFYPTEDGWVTLPAVEAPGTTEYDVEIYAPGCAYITYPCKNGLAPPFNEENLPKFLKMPEEKRVLFAKYADDRHRYVPFRQSSFYGIQYSLDAVRIFFMEWPILMCDVYGNTPPNGMWNKTEFQASAPHYKENYFQKMLSYVHNMQEGMSMYEAKAANEPDEAKKRDIHARVQELRARLMTIVCEDLQEKKELWDSHKLPDSFLNDPGLKRWAPNRLKEWEKREEEEAKQNKRGFDPPSRFLDDPFVQEMDCEALREFNQIGSPSQKEK